MIMTVADVNGWQVEDDWDDEWDEGAEESKDDWGVVRRLEANWKTFVKGGHSPIVPRGNRKERKPRREYPEPESQSDDETIS
jgi:hypothetical protein